MQMETEEIVTLTIDFVKEKLNGAEAGHDWFHIERVFNIAQNINSTEHGDPLIVALAALLHDIADSKFNNGDEEAGPLLAGQFMQTLQLPQDLIVHVQQIIRNMSFKASLGEVHFHSKELDIVQDADRLDAIGAIGIARAFTYGGFKNRVMYDPAIASNPGQDKESYKNSTSPTINHFYEKLLLLKDLMKTETGKALAIRRHAFMLNYLDQFYAEWDAKM